MEAASILLEQGGPLAIAAFHIQQAIEKYLKGYLLNTGWQLRRIHDLETLAQQAAQEDEAFTDFVAPCQRITEYYIEARYPIGTATEFSAQGVEADLATAESLRTLIRSRLHSPSP
ncbi:MAG: HEPN domain-containing protein [Anaerolineae bacterium]|nr:HEPN domain-containing protein [Anaerolineae bacterium]